MNSCRIRATLAAAVVMIAPAVSQATVNNDQVQSQHLREADGTSGQNTNAGSGVKTLHLQDGAVTTNKVAAGAITEAKIADRAVTAAKLGVTCPDGYFLQYTTFVGWTCSAGTAGPAGATGPQGPAGPAGPAHDFANVIVVAKSGGDFTDLAAAVASIVDASATNPYVVRIAPGVYSVGSASLQVPPYVDIVGAGEGVTRIVGTADAGNMGNNAVVNLNSGASEMSDVTVENLTTGTGSIGVWGGRMRRVTVVVASGALRNIGIFAWGPLFLRDVKVAVSAVGTANYGIADNFGSQYDLMDVRVSVTGPQSCTGLYSGGANSSTFVNVDVSVSCGGYGSAFQFERLGSPQLRGVRATAQGGSENYGIALGGTASPRIDSSVITASTGTIYARDGVTASAFVGGSRLDGGPVYAGAGSTVTCAGVYDEAYVFHPSDCP